MTGNEKDAVRANVEGLPRRRLTWRDVLAHTVRLNRGEFLWIGAFSAVVMLLTFATPVFVAQIFSTVIPNADRSLLAQIFAMSLAFTVARSFVAFANGCLSTRIRRTSSWHLQTAVMDRVLDFPLDFFRRHAPGDLQARMRLVRKLVEAFNERTVMALLGSLTMIPAAIMMFVYSPFAALLLVPCVILFGVLEILTLRVALRLDRNGMDADGEALGDFAQFVVGVLKIRSACAEETCERRLGEKFLDVCLFKRAGQIAYAIPSVMIEALPLALFLAMGLAALGSLGEPGGMTSGSCAGFISAAALFSAPASQLYFAFGNLVAALPMLQRIRPFLETEPELRSGDGMLTTDPPLEGGIEVSGVSYAYPGAPRPVLTDVSIRVRPGETVAITGPSGSGKSTLLRIMLGLERPTSGSVRYDGVDLARRDSRRLRRGMGVVMQNARTLPNTIRGAILGDAGDLGDRDAWAAAEAAGIAEDIRAMPMGMDTVLASGGGVSGGQRQRIVIARAIVRKPKVMVMDEATSALDNNAQRAVTDSLARLKGLTKVIVAHRLSTIRTADRIYMLEKGRIVEEGTFEGLMEKKGAFATMVGRQL